MAPKNFYPAANTSGTRPIGEGLQSIVDYKRNGAAAEKRFCAQNVVKSGVGSEGGFLLSTGQSYFLLQKVYEQSHLAKRCIRVEHAGRPQEDRVVAPIVSEAARVDGGRFGGVSSGWLADREAIPAGIARFDALKLQLKKVGALLYATDELLQDTPTLTGIVENVLTAELAWRLDEAIYRGIGAKQPLGILNSAACITVDAELGQAPGSIVAANLGNMVDRFDPRSWENAIWYTSLFGLRQIVNAAGTSRAYDSTSQTLYGRPIQVIEHASTLGSVGDIALADMSAYALLEQPLKSTVSVDVAFLNDESVFRFVLRVDGGSTWSQPITPARGPDTISPFVTLGARI